MLELRRDPEAVARRLTHPLFDVISLRDYSPFDDENLRRRA
jgi:hypothetical protein